MRGPDRDATAADLVAARNVLGAHVGLKPFKYYVQMTYGRVADDVLRFLRGEEPMQVFAPPPRSEGKAATTGRTDDGYLGLVTHPKGDPTYKHLMVAQNAYTRYILRFL